MTRRLQMTVLVITEGRGADKAGVLQEDIRLCASKIVRECWIESVRDKVDCADCVPGIRTQIPVLKITQIALHVAGVLQRRVEVDDGGV